MSIYIDLPSARLSKIELSDWMEISALLDETDNSSSIEEMISLLKISTTDNRDDEIRADISSELISRTKKLQDAYPFSFNGIVLSVKNPNDFTNQWAYIFCLLISYFGVNKGQTGLALWKQNEMTSMFEHISTIAAKNFLSSNEVEAKELRFGFPRDTLDPKYKSFKSALSLLKSVIQEGTIRENPVCRNQKDAGLDIVVWRDFPDGKTNKILLLGQCAAGTDFKEKRNDIQKIEGFFSFLTDPIRGFFIPHELDDDDWGQLSYDSYIGIIFDRSRVASYSKNWDGKGFKLKFKSIKATLRKKR